MSELSSPWELKPASAEDGSSGLQRLSRALLPPLGLHAADK